MSSTRYMLIDAIPEMRDDLYDFYRDRDEAVAVAERVVAIRRKQYHSKQNPQQVEVRDDTDCWIASGDGARAWHVYVIEVDVDGNHAWRARHAH